MRSIHAQIIQEYEKTLLKPSGGGKNWKLRWQNSKIIEDLP